MMPAMLPAVRNDDRDLVELWLSLKTSDHTRRAYAFEAGRFLTALGKPLSGATLRDVQDWAAGLERGIKPATLNRSLTAIKSLFAFGHETGYLPFNVAVAVKLRPRRDDLAQRILDEDAVAQLIAAAGEGRDRVLLKLLYVSGARVSEICGLRWRDTVARQGGGQVTLYGKGGKTRTVLLRENVWGELMGLREGSDAGEPVFQSRKGRGQLDPSHVRRIVYAAARKAGLAQKVSPHWMRHAHASHALDHHAPIHLVQATLGHASVATTGRYLHARPAESSSFYLPD
jgi:site-specific recombinase XerD